MLCSGPFSKLPTSSAATSARSCLRTIAPRASGAICARYRPPNMALTRFSVSKSPDSTTRF
eukprot:5713695-Prymnesium_polylepis.1